jgi:hypothetical protein
LRCKSKAAEESKRWENLSLCETRKHHFSSASFRKFLRLQPLSDPSNFACMQLLSDSSSLIAKRIAKEFLDCSSVRSFACLLLFFFFFSSLNLHQWTKFQKKSVAKIHLDVQEKIYSNKPWCSRRNLLQ